jgi:nucleotide-binding universal stress UspA family protein
MTNALPTKILLATDGSGDAELAERAAVDLASRSGAELHVIHAWQDLPQRLYPTPNAAYFTKIHAREARNLLERQIEQIKTAGIQIAGAHLKLGPPVEEIVELAAELDVGLVVVGSRGLSRTRRLLTGSVSEGVVQHATCPVLVVRGGEEAWPPARVVVGDDGSEEARRAAEEGESIGELLGASTLLMHVYEGLPRNPQLLPREELMLYEEVVADDLKRAGEALEGRAAGLAEATGVRPETRVVTGDAAPALLEAADEGAGPSLVVVGSRHQGAARRVLLGSISTGVLRAAPGPVLVCPPAREAGDGTRARSAREELTR